MKPSISPSSSVSEGGSSPNRGYICCGSSPRVDKAVVINLFNRVLVQGIQQQPQRVNIAANTATDINSEETRVLYLPKTSSQLSHMDVSTPECSFILWLSERRPSTALVREPSGAVLLGMKVQQASPNIEQTLPFSANSMSTAILFWNAIKDVADNWLCTASNPLCVQFPSFRTL